MKHTVLAKTAVAVAVLVAAGTASAALTTAKSYTGNVGLSVDGFGSNEPGGGTVQASIPVGSTILQAYLYSSRIIGATDLSFYNGSGITLQGNTISNFDTLVGAPGWSTARADVTNLVKSLTNSAATNSFSWTITEGSQNTLIDGEVLAILYSNPLLPLGSVALLDGGQNRLGETTTVSFASAISDPTATGFAAQLGLGISYSFPNQASTVTVNGSPLTSFAGDYDDGTGENGGLMTVGGLGDDPSNNVANYADDDELYDLRPFLKTGDTSFKIFTNNPSNDDNIFFASLYTTAKLGDINDVPPVDLPPTDPTAPIPEPETYALMLMGLGVVGAMARRRRNKN